MAIYDQKYKSNQRRRHMTKNQTYQVWMRTWDTLEYVSPLYLTAESFDDAFNKMEIFRDKYQVKSCLAEGDHITEDPRFNIV